ncbi:MAG: NAD(+) synthase [Eubacteriales bacterium]|nr:NAD(+) synthase [Eubacteriales bacterium]
MQDGYIRVAAATPEMRVADPEFNQKNMAVLMHEAAREEVKILVFPELSVSGYTCGDLFFQSVLIEASKRALFQLVKESEGLDMLVFAGVPWAWEGKLYNAACAFRDGKILAVIPKTYLPNYEEFYEQRYFTEGIRETEYIPDEMSGEGRKIPFGTDILLCCENIPELKVACEICEDGWAPYAPSNRHAVAGATVIVNLSASDAVSGKKEFRRQLIRAQSSRLLCAYIYASAGTDESTSDLVFSGHDMIAEAGDLLCERIGLFEGNGFCMTEIDLMRLEFERRRTTTFENRRRTHMGDGGADAGTVRHTETGFCIERENVPVLTRQIDPSPFIPKGSERSEQLREMVQIQAAGLIKRLNHTGLKRVIIGLSGGLDSTLALLVAVKAFRLADLAAKDIICVTMPAFGTTDRTYDNACSLARTAGATLREIDIKASVLQHFKDIGHDPEVHNAAYENAQARERTQILMDLSNDLGALVIGTGDMSENALGWCTYNGDHMSMYAVNIGVPKTLVRHLVRYYAEEETSGKLSEVLLDVLDTPVSPELLPPDKDGKIAQKTEDLVGPYELHDFFLYQVLAAGLPPKRVFRMARHAFAGQYEDEVILKWLKTFYRRFFSQQFKRSCSVDGPKVVCVDLSPRGSLRMPSDAAADAWLSELSDEDLLK